MLYDVPDRLPAFLLGSGSLESHRGGHNHCACCEKCNLGVHRASADTIRHPFVHQPVEEEGA